MSPLRITHGYEALSLIETMIAVLVSIILGTLCVTGWKRLSIEAGGTHCMTHMREISSAILNYTLEHDGCFPPHSVDTTPGREKRWPTLFFDSLGKKTFECPSLEKGANLPASGQFVSYGYNNKLSPGLVQTRISQIGYPSETVLLAETLITAGQNANKAGFYQVDYWPNNASVRTHARHGLGVLIAWVDGHISMEKTELPNDAIPAQWLRLQKE